MGRAILKHAVKLHPVVQELAQRALVAYVRSIFLQPNKAVFDASALPAADFALSMGLTSVPKLRFLKRHGPKKAGKGPVSSTDLQCGIFNLLYITLCNCRAYIVCDPLSSCMPVVRFAQSVDRLLQIFLRLRAICIASALPASAAMPPGMTKFCMQGRSETPGGRDGRSL